MPLLAAEKTQIIQAHQLKPGDTGSASVQIALLTKRISDLTDHLKLHKHDIHTRYGLTKLVSQRRRLIKYLKRTQLSTWLSLMETLAIRG